MIDQDEIPTAEIDVREFQKPTEAESIQRARDCIENAVSALKVAGKAVQYALKLCGDVLSELPRGEG